MADAIVRNNTQQQGYRILQLVGIYMDELMVG